MSKQELELIEEKFRGLASLFNARFENMADTMDYIKEDVTEIKAQTTKTNKRIDDAEIKIIEIEKRELTHIQHCELVPKFEIMNKELEEYRMMKKYPKLFIAGLVVVVLLSFATFLTNNPLKVFNKELIHTEYVQK